MTGRTSRARRSSSGSSASRRAAAAADDAAERDGWDEPAGWADPETDETGKPDSEKDDPESVARIICLRMLTAAPRTHAELATTLRRRGVPDDAAQAVLARFAEVKLIDDAMFARAWVESRHHSRGLASRALGAELRRRGVAREDIASALDELDPEQEVSTARDLVGRRLAGTRGQPVPARMRRLVGMLARKGYSPSLAYRVVREALEQEAADSGRALYYPGDLEEPEIGDDDTAGL
jgi:regulatory protein